ncbi:SOS response-associated peptidase [Alkalibacillus haloalkaliphilus]|uniref:SOS response-associated peptidase n=1 Tax=Alkalibacillus haloalkaliphilus TaxID=94136 RepID=UPI0002EFCE9A|nr:SOS response-associated peptidase [Alkalibacillus haloalkaliphilus]
MCGRFTLTVGERFLKQHFNVANVDWDPSYNIAPTQDVLAVVHDGSSNRLGKMSWGLIPSWAKDESMRSKMINARLETADEKPSFKRLMAKRRCLILADSFYEWVKVDGEKKPVRIYPPNHDYFAFAGLWDRWQTAEGEEMVTCTILTKEANDTLEPIHHRMPVILPREYEQDWIDFEAKEPSEIKEWVKAVSDIPLDYYEVSTYVNSPRNNDETCIERVE